MGAFKQFLIDEGIWGNVGVQVNAIKKHMVRSYAPDKLRVGIAALTSTGKAIGYASDGNIGVKKAENLKKWRDDILSGKRKLRGTMTRSSDVNN